MVAHSSLTDTSIAFVTTYPVTAPNHIGEVLAVKESTPDGTTFSGILVATDTIDASDWQVVAWSTTLYFNNINGFVTSRVDGQIIIDGATDTAYYSGFAGSTAWTALAGGTGGGY